MPVDNPSNASENPLVNKTVQGMITVLAVLATATAKQLYNRCLPHHAKTMQARKATADIHIHGR